MSEVENSIGYGTAQLMRKVSEIKLHCVVPDETFQAWLVLARTMRIADDFIDNEKDPALRSVIYKKAVDYLSGKNENLQIEDAILPQEMSNLKTVLFSIPEEQRNSFVLNLRNLLNVTEKLKTIDDPIDFAKITMLEGQILAHMFANFLPKEFANLDSYHDYIKYFTRLSRGINAFDSFVDFPADFENEITVTKPTRKNIFLYVAETLRNNMFIISHSNFEILRLSITGASTIAEDRNGDSPIHFH